jgi:membrane associated rhomboid family serine protease
MEYFNSNKREVLGYPLLLLLLIWTLYIGDYQLNWQLYKLGVLPREVNGLVGILFMPLIHSQNDFNHILNNSLPIVVLLSSLIYFYRSIAFKVFILIWLLTGIGTWLIARENYHIGMSGVIYGLVGFLFISGAVRKYRPLMGLSLFIVFLYGSLIWGIFPMKEHVSWEGHLTGFIFGILLAYFFRKQGPQAPKYRYEIEKEMGIEPEDLEEKWRQLNTVELKTVELNNVESSPINNDSNSNAELRVHYSYIPKKEKDT